VVLTMLLVLSSSAGAATLGVGARAAGMGGVGIATANDITAAYYNPACLVKAGRAFDLRVSLGYAYSNLNELTDAFSKMGDPADFFVEYYGKKFDANGSLRMAFGMSVIGFGLSAIPTVTLTGSKIKDSFEGSFNGQIKNELPFTFGGSLNMLNLPFVSAFWGANIKYVMEGSGNLNIGGGVPTVEAITYSQLGSGVGLDLGALFSLDIPGLNETSVGIVLKDVLESINYEKTSRQDIFNNITGEVTKGAESKVKEAESAPITIGVGASTTLPLSGTLFAADLEIVGGTKGESTMKFGVEQPVLGFAALRAGMSTGSESSISFGTGIRAGANFDIAYVIDSEDYRANAFVFELGAAF